MIIYPMYACVSDSSSICVLLGNVIWLPLTWKSIKQQGIKTSELPRELFCNNYYPQISRAKSGSTTIFIVKKLNI